MSLQVWLPLIGTLENKGLSNIAFTNNGATVNAAGKIGSCYSFNGSSNYLYSSYKFYSSNYTVCAWVYTTSTTATQTICCDRTAVGSGFSIFLIGGKLRIDPGGNNLQWTTNYTYPANTWFHLAVTYDGSKVYYYINGEFKESSSQSISSTYWGTITSIGASQASGSSYGNYINGRLNDVRIYNNCLSDKEVKEISRGLVLHYPLSDRYIENTTNLITAEDCLSSTCYNGAISKYSYGENTNMYKTVGTFQGRKCTKVYNQTSGTGMYPYVYINNMYTSNGTNAPEYKTLSFDYYSTISTSICPYKLGNGTGTATYKVTNTEIKTGTGTNSVTIPVKSNMWNHVEITFHGTTDADAQWGYIQNQPSHTASTSNYWLFANMQLEAKDHATGYAGVNSTRTATIAKDTSGFGYNGTLNSTFTINPATPKYNVSTKFTGTNYISLTSPTAEAKTLSIWVKWDTIPSGQSIVFLDYKSKLGLGLISTGILCGTSGPGNFYTFSKSSLVANTWYHFVVVNTGTATSTTRDLYINGVKQTQTSSASNWTYSVDQTQIGKRSTSSDGFVGLLSDVRLYATALSANDVLSLYNNGAYIDSAGNIHGQIR